MRDSWHEINHDGANKKTTRKKRRFSALNRSLGHFMQTLVRALDRTSPRYTRGGNAEHKFCI